MKPYVYVPIGTAALMHLSKPSDASFNLYLLKSVTNKCPDTSAVDLALVNIGIKYALPVYIKDYGIIKTVSMAVPKDKNYYFIGAFQNWFFVGENKHD